MSIKLKKGLLGLTGFLIVANSQALTLLPNSVQPQQVSKAIIEQDNARITNNNVTQVTNSQPYSSDLNEQTTQLKFKLNGIKIINAKSISPSELYPIYAAKLHTTITLENLLEIVGNITNYYRNRGYITSQAVLVPQRAHKGIVTIKIVEGYIDTVFVTGDPKKSARLVELYSKKIQQNNPLNQKQMERYLLLTDEIPGTKVQSILTPSPTKPGASDLILNTQHQLLNGYLSYDDYGTRYIGPQQITGNIGLNSFLTSGDSGQLTAAKTPRGNELTFIDANYNLPIMSEGDRLVIGGTSTKTQPLFVLEPANIIGLNKNYYANFTIPAIREMNQNLTYIAGFNYNNTRVTSFNTKLYGDYIRSLGLGFLYDNADRYRGTNSIYSDIRKGLPIAGYTTNTNPLTAMTSRPGGSATYTKVDLTISRLQQLGASHFSLYGLAKGQYGFQSLLVAEQFAYGGSQLGRGYDPAELLGDKALAGSAELRYDFNLYRKYISILQLYAFYEIGKIWNYSANPIPSYNISAASTGLGARFVFTKNLYGNFWIAKPLTKSVAAEAIVNEPHTTRGFFSIVAIL